ncbi:MAG: hypothetical protein V1760_02335, partial [Candidatus Peregrinibacteria bacterium]
MLTKKVGALHGISHVALQAACKKNQSLVDKVFKNKRQAGYAFLDLPDDVALIRHIKKFAADQKKQG